MSYCLSVFFGIFLGFSYVCVCFFVFFRVLVVFIFAFFFCVFFLFFFCVLVVFFFCFFFCVFLCCFCVFFFLCFVFCVFFLGGGWFCWILFSLFLCLSPLAAPDS